MGLTYDEVKAQKKHVAQELEKTLREQFNRQGLSVSHGIGWNEDGDYDFAMMIVDLNDPDNAPPAAIIDAATAKIKDMVPGSKPSVSGQTVPRAF